MNTNFDINEIEKTFKDRYSSWGLELKDFEEIYEGKYKLSSRGWIIRSIIGENYLEFYSSHRMTSDSHYRIYTDGSVEKLESAREAYTFDPKIEGDKERKQQEYFEYNRRIGKMLKDIGLSD